MDSIESQIIEQVQSHLNHITFAHDRREFMSKCWKGFCLRCGEHLIEGETTCYCTPWYDSEVNMSTTKEKRRELEELMKHSFLDFTDYDVELKVSDLGEKFFLIIEYKPSTSQVVTRTRSEDMTEQELRAFLKGVQLGGTL